MTTTLTVPGIFAAIGDLLGQPDVMADFYQRQCTTIGQTLPERVAPGWGPVSKVVKTNHTAMGIVRELQKLPADEDALVMAHSMGSLAVLSYLKRYERFGRDPNHTRFLISGANIAMVGEPYVINSPYRVIDVVLQWEKYSDPPTVRTSPFFQRAENNSRELNLHTTGYQNVSLNSPPAQQSSNGSVTYLYYETPRKPIGATRSDIETAYNRRYLRGRNEETS